MGKYKSKEVTQAYISLPDAPCRVPQIDLKAFCKTELRPGEEKEISFSIKPITYIDEQGNKQKYKGKVILSLGSCQGDERSKKLGLDNNITTEFYV